MSERPTGVRAVRLTVTGTVQGVGFRPFVARVAAEHDLAGSVRNTDRGVEVRFEGDPGDVEAGVDRVRSEPPRLASVEGVSRSEATVRGTDTFEIGDSAGGQERTALVPPDTAVCADCVADFRDPDSRFEGYWATACVNCGPRFTITRTLPYDREGTAMGAFERCGDCRREYEEPGARRFHAQTVACPDCGPTLRYVGRCSSRTTGNAALDAAASTLRVGGTVGIKGAGGSHLACRARDREAVERLRERTGRARKPFAVMAPSVSAVREFASVSTAEAGSLTGRRRPVVVLDGRDRGWLDAVAPGLHTVGAMLPYSGLHHLLFDRVDGPLVMTSANRPGEPMCTTTEELLGLDCHDGALLHDREVVNRCDDSVLRHVDGDRRLLRRSRGWVPERLPRPVAPGREVLALGGAFDVTAALTDGESVIPSQHVGDVTGPATEDFLRSATDHLVELVGQKPDVVAHDRHPDFLTTAVASERPERAVAVQHHHAHAAALLAEHGRDRAVVVVADGTGYGPEGVVRGGEVLDATLAGAERVGGVGRFRLPGGDLAAQRPARLLASLLGDPERRSLLPARGVEQPAAVCRQADGGVNSPPTTSAGRLLDAASALLGLCTERGYQGEPAMRLEAAASEGTPVPVDPPLAAGERGRVLDPAATLSELRRLAATRSTADTAATAQAVLADGLGEVAVEAARERGLDTVGFTGGVALSPAISSRLRERVEAVGLTFLGPERVPPGDAGLSYGQAVVASARLTD
jgi:hydrogenase maturation protein HypF